MALNFGMTNMFPSSEDFDQGVQMKPYNVGTREAWYQMEDTGGSPVFWGDYTVFVAGPTGGQVGTVFKMPDDFSQVESMKVILIPASGNVIWDVDFAVMYAKEGEVYTANRNIDTSSTYNLISGNMTKIDITDQMTGIDNQDMVAVRLYNNDLKADLNVLGLELKYS